MHCRNKMKGHFMRPESQELTLRSAMSDPLHPHLDGRGPCRSAGARIDAAADRGKGHAKPADQSQLRLLGVIASPSLASKPDASIAGWYSVPTNAARRFHARQRWRAYFAVVQTMPHRPAA
jgi:hypothetical protein